jgi:hypothetical protein
MIPMNKRLECDIGVRFIITDYVEQALSQAAYTKLEDGTLAGRIPPCKDIAAFRGPASVTASQSCAHSWRDRFWMA